MLNLINKLYMYVILDVFTFKSFHGWFIFDSVLWEALCDPSLGVLGSDHQGSIFESIRKFPGPNRVCMLTKLLQSPIPLFN